MALDCSPEFLRGPLPTFFEVFKLWKQSLFCQAILNKRAMMALDRYIFPTNEFYIFVPLVPTCDPQGAASFDPKGHHVNKIDKGLQGDATYRKSKLYLFQFQRRRILKLVFFVPMFQLVTPGVGSVLTPRASYEQTW